MCAINGFNFKDPDLIRRMNALTAHRGPDRSKIFTHENVSLGHNRLSIVDPAPNSNQPMVSATGNSVITFNGEIYNYRELRAQLWSHYPFETKSDTEVIIAAYEKWGRHCVHHLKGIFSFAIYDRTNNHLFLARDRSGIKPLYYFYDGVRFIFSSEIKAILCHDIPRVMDHQAFDHYMRLHYVPTPLTMFHHVKKLPAGHAAFVIDGNCFIYCYSEIEESQNSKDGFLDANQITHAIDTAVQSQMVSHKASGVYLSGGLDSSIILDAASRTVSESTIAFSVGFDVNNSEDEIRFNADLRGARKTARHYNVPHHEVMIGPSDVIDFFEKSVWHNDEPNSNPTSIALMKLARYSKQHVDVILGGEGGDELFGGYDRYRLSLKAGYFNRLPDIFKKPLTRIPVFKKLSTPEGVDRYALFMFEKDSKLAQVINREHINRSTHDFFQSSFFNESHSPFEELMMSADRKGWFTDHVLSISDHMSMSHGIEARLPLLDENLSDLARSIPIHQKVGLFTSKQILRHAFKNRLPQHLLKQPKRGFFAPSSRWLRHPTIAAMAKDFLSTSFAPETNHLFNHQGIQLMLEDHVSGRANHRTILWAIMNFKVWARQFSVQIPR